jgi:hypothetical protein
VAKENGNGKLEKGLQAPNHVQATLVQTQASCLAQKASSDKRFNEFEKENADWRRKADARFERIEQILIKHNHVLQFLADKVGEKIGFKSQPIKNDG